MYSVKSERLHGKTAFPFGWPGGLPVQASLIYDHTLEAVWYVHAAFFCPYSSIYRKPVVYSSPKGKRKSWSWRMDDAKVKSGTEENY